MFLSFASSITLHDGELARCWGRRACRAKPISCACLKRWWVSSSAQASTELHAKSGRASLIMVVANSHECGEPGKG
jgi:hypothetical protein